MTQRQPRIRERRELVLLAAILAAAAALRLVNLDAVRFNIDNAYPVWQAFDILHTGDLPRVGPATLVFVGNHPILSAYLYLPFLALFPSPTAVHAAVALCNTVAVAACYFAAKSLFRGDARPALVAAWLMALNPWVVFYSRQVWPPGLVPFYVCTIAWLLVPVLLGEAVRPRRRLFFALLLTTMMTQTTLIGLVFLAPLTFALILFYHRISARAMAAGIAVFAAATALFLSGLPDAVERAVDFATASPRLNDGALLNAIRLTSGLDFAISYGGASLPDAELRQSIGIVLHYVVGGLLLAGAVTAFLTVFRRRDGWKIAAVVLGWLLLPILAMSYTDAPVHLYYLLVTLPAGYWLVAWGSRPLLRSKIGAVVMTVFLLAWGAVMALHVWRSNQEALEQPGSFGLWALPLRDAQRLGDAISARMPEGGTVFARTDSRLVAALTEGRYTSLLAETRWPRVAIVPRNGGLYIDVSDAGESPIPVPFTTITGSIPLADGHAITIRTFDVPERPLDTVRGRVGATTEQGITLCCYELFRNPDNEVWILDTYWVVERTNSVGSGDGFGMFTHVFDADGRQIDNIAGEIVPSHHWRAGDIHIHRTRFRLEDGTAFTLRIGQFDPINQRNVIFIKDGVWSDTIKIEGAPTR